MSCAPRNLSRVGRYTWRRHAPAQVATGLVQGLVGLASFAAMRSLGAPAWIAPAMVVISQASWMASPMWENVVARTGPQRAFRMFGALAMLTLLGIAFVDVQPTSRGDGHGVGDLTLFLVCYALCYVSVGGQIAQRGALIRTNYKVLNRGRVFGLLSLVARSAQIVSAKAAGFLLNMDPRWLRVVFPVAGLLYLVENVQLSRIRWRRGRAEHEPGSGFRASWARCVSLLRDDHQFRRYEIAWTLYGTGFLMSTPMIVVFGESDLQVSYNEWTWAQGVAMPVAGIIGTPFAGRLVDRLGPVRMTALSFVVLSLFFALIPFVTTAVELVAAFALMGFAMAVSASCGTSGPSRSRRRERDVDTPRHTSRSSDCAA